MKGLALSIFAIALGATQVGAESISQLLSKKCSLVGEFSGLTPSSSVDGGQQLDIRAIQFLIFQCPEFRVFSCPTTVVASPDDPAKLGLSTSECLQIKNMD